MIADVPRLGAGIPLVARRAEMHTLREAWRLARSGRPSVVLLSGDAGVGKSRLLTELSRLAHDEEGVVLTGRCLDTADAALPYLPFAEAVGALAGHDPEATDAHPALGRMLPGHHERGPASADERDVGRLQLFDAVCSALTRFATGRTVVLAIEDLHWADRSSRDLFAFLASRLSAQRLLVIGTYRTDDLHRRHPLRPLLAELVRLPAIERVHLDPFTSTDARAFVRALDDETLDEDTVTRIAERSEGNAFVAEELVSASGDAVPRELAELLLARTERLAPGAQQSVRLASVIGKRFDHDRLTAASALDATALDEALREAITHHILVMDDAGHSYSFRHALLREAVYTDLLPGERSRLHRDVAAALSGDNRPGAAAELAHHSMESHDSIGALAASIRAAREADELAAPAETLAHVERSLRLWHGVDEAETVSGLDELRLTIWAADAAGASGEPDRAIAHSRSAIRMTDSHGDPHQAAEVRRAYARYLLTLENTEQLAYDTAHEAWRLIAETEPSAAKAWVQSTLARAAVANRADEVPRLAEAAMATAQAVAGDGPQTAAWADALITRTVIVDRRVRPTDGVLGALAEAAELARKVDAHEVELRARYQRGITFLDAARLSEATEALDEAIAHADRTGLRWSPYGLETRVLQVVCRFMVGDWDGAEAGAELVGEGVSGTVMTRLSAAGLLVAVGRGRFDVADRRLAYARDRWELDQQVMTLVGLCGAELESWRGNPARATRCAEEALGRLRASDPRHLAAVSLCAVGIAAYADEAGAARRSGDTPAADRAIAAGDRLAGHAVDTVAHGSPLTGTLGAEGQAWSALARAEASRLRGPGDPHLWRQAIDAFAYGEPYRQAYAHWRRAEVLLTGGEPSDRAEAAVHLRHATRIAADLGAVPLRDAAERLARRARLRPDGSTKPADNLLTPRELAVLRLVAAGNTNRRIGAELYISEKTVSVHLSRVMAKLEAGSRTEAVSAAYTRGLLGSAPG